MINIKINVESYNAYNSGFLLGEWHDISYLDEDEFSLLMQKIKKDTEKKLSKENKDPEMIYSVCEEFFCIDYEVTINNQDLNYSLNTESCLDVDPWTVFKLKETFEEIENINDEACTAEYAAAYTAVYVILLKTGLGHKEALSTCHDGFLVEYSDNKHEDIGYYFVDELSTFDIPENMKNYFDYESYGHDVCRRQHVDLEINGQNYAFFYN